MPRTDQFAGFEFDWLGVDQHGHVAVSSAGAGARCLRDPGRFMPPCGWGSGVTSTWSGSPLIIRPARVQDVRQMARVHVRCWQETYRGLMPDAVLDDPGFPAARERMWTEVLTSGRYRQNRAAVAERDDELAGIAMSGPP